MTARTANILVNIGAVVFVVCSPLAVIVYRIVKGVWPL